MDVLERRIVEMLIDSQTRYMTLFKGN